MSNENEPKPVEDTILGCYADDLDTMEDRETIRAIAFELRKRREADAKAKAPVVNVGGRAVSSHGMLGELIETLGDTARGAFSRATSISIELVTFREGLVARVTHRFDERWPIDFRSEWVAIVDITTQWKHENNRMLRLIDVIRDYRECVQNARAMGVLPPLGQVEGKEPDRPPPAPTVPPKPEPTAIKRVAVAISSMGITSHFTTPFEAKIGTLSSCQVRLPDDGVVARMHAVIEGDHLGRVTVMDLGSNAGVFVGMRGKPRTKIAREALVDGDEISIGGHVVRVEIKPERA